jgi:alpha-tubulin suppressor-like RCC1 family protein
MSLRALRALVVCLTLFPAVASAQTVAAGYYHTLVVASDGTVWSFGKNDFGQLGLGTSHATTDVKVPTQIPGLSSIVAVAANANHSLALGADGTVWSWGENGSKQVGNNSTATQKSPVAVMTNAIAIAAGINHSVALAAGGTVWAWGGNASGQIGTGSTSPATIGTPTPMTAITGVTSIAAGFEYTLAVKSDGSAWGWGMNANGRLGTGTPSPTLTPAAVTGITTAVSVVATGYCHSLAVLTDGSMRGWGCNSDGRVGNNATATSQTTPATVVSISAAARAAGGFRHSLAVTASGELRAWGEGDFYQLGDGTDTSRKAPVSVSGFAAPVAHAAAGREHSVAVTTTGIVYTWGQNGDGQLGDGTNADKATPTPISEEDFAWKTGTPFYTPVAGAFDAVQTVTIASSTPDATIRYSTDGTIPDETYPVASGSITVDRTMTLTARAWSPTRRPSNVRSEVFTLTVKTPTISPPGGTFTTGQTVTITTATPGGTTRYTTDGSTPTELSQVYPGSLSISTPTRVKAVTFMDGWTPSAVASVGYSFSNYNPGPVGISPDAGPHPAAPVTVSLGSEAPGALIEYNSKAGTVAQAGDPTTNYSTPISISRTTTFKVRQRVLQPNNNWAYGPITSITFVLKVVTPTIDLADGAYAPGTRIQSASATPDAVLRYRLDGQTPTDSDPIVPAEGLMVGNYTLAVRGFYNSMDPSDVVTRTYTVTGSYSTGALAAGRGYAMALMPDGVVWTWGENNRRELGFGERRIIDGNGNPVGELVVDNLDTPTRAGITGVKAIAAGWYTGVAVRQDGSVYTWGENDHGALGRSTCTLPYSSGTCVRPEKVTGLPAIVAVAAGTHHTLALAADGRVFAWGLNAWGQLGDGTETSRSAPAAVVGLTNIVAIAAGDHHSLALGADGRVFAWGENNYWQVTGDHKWFFTVGDNEFRANESAVFYQDWESTRFQIERVAGPGAVLSGDRIRLRTSTGQYVSAIGGGGAQTTLVGVPGPDEEFVLTIVPE